jgi:hypothetical protein
MDLYSSQLLWPPFGQPPPSWLVDTAAWTSLHFHRPEGRQQRIGPMVWRGLTLEQDLQVSLFLVASCCLTLDVPAAGVVDVAALLLSALALPHLVGCVAVAGEPD